MINHIVLYIEDNLAMLVSVCVYVDVSRQNGRIDIQTERTNGRTNTREQTAALLACYFSHLPSSSLSLYRRWTTNSCCTHSACFGSMMCFFFFARGTRPRTVSSRFSFFFFLFNLHNEETISICDGEKERRRRRTEQHWYSTFFSMIWADRSMYDYISFVEYTCRAIVKRVNMSV